MTTEQAEDDYYSPDPVQHELEPPEPAKHPKRAKSSHKQNRRKAMKGRK